MSRDEIVEWLERPRLIRKEYEQRAEELAALMETPLHGVNYDYGNNTHTRRDLSDYSMKIERKRIQAASTLLKYHEAVDTRAEILLDVPNGHVLAMYYFSGYNQKDIAAEYGVNKYTVCRWIREALDALARDTDLILKK